MTTTGFREFIYNHILSSKRTILLTGVLLTFMAVLFLSLWVLPQHGTRKPQESVAGVLLLGVFLFTGIMWIRKGISAPEKNLFYNTLVQHPEQIVWLHPHQETTFAGESYYIKMYLNNGHFTSFICPSKVEMETLYLSARSFCPHAVSEYREEWFKLYQQNAKEFADKIKA